MRGNGVLRTVKGNIDKRYKENNVECLICHKMFKSKPSAIKRGCGKFCSRKCVSIYNMNNVQPEPIMPDPNINDLMWAVGFYDGEGSISCSKNNLRNYTRIQISITQKRFNGITSDTLTKFKDIIGIGNIYLDGRRRDENACEQLCISKYGEVKRFCRLFYPYVSNYKKFQMKKACDLYKEHTGREIIDEKF